MKILFTFHNLCVKKGFLSMTSMSEAIKKNILFNEMQKIWTKKAQWTNSKINVKQSKLFAAYARTKTQKSNGQSPNKNTNSQYIRGKLFSSANHYRNINENKILKYCNWSSSRLLLYQFSEVNSHNISGGQSGILSAYSLTQQFHF